MELCNDVVVLPEEKLLEADEYLNIAAVGMKRQWPSQNQRVNELLRRSCFQVIWSERVYVIGWLESNTSTLKIKGAITWGCQVYVDRWYCDPKLKECELYLFDQTSNQWMQWLEVWVNISMPPRPHGIYAGLGSRELTPAGLDAISKLYSHI